jgi:hypothetical protein
MKFPVLVLDSLESRANLDTLIKEKDKILIDLSKKLLFSEKRDFLKFFKTEISGKSIFLLHKDLIPSCKLDILCYLKNEICKRNGTTIDTSVVLKEKVKITSTSKSITSKTINFKRSINAEKAKQELELPHTKIIKESSIFYTHDLQDALDSEDEDLDF